MIATTTVTPSRVSPLLLVGLALHVMVVAVFIAAAMGTTGERESTRPLAWLLEAILVVGPALGNGLAAWGVGQHRDQVPWLATLTRISFSFTAVLFAAAMLGLLCGGKDGPISALLFAVPLMAASWTAVPWLGARRRISLSAALSSLAFALFMAAPLAAAVDAIGRGIAGLASDSHHGDHDSPLLVPAIAGILILGTLLFVGIRAALRPSPSISRPPPTNG